MEDVCNIAIIVERVGDESFYGEFEVLLSSQQVTNLAAVMARCCISPNRYVSLLASGMSLKSLHAFVNRGKCLFLMSSYDWQEVRKCSSVSSWFCVQWEHSLSSLGSQVCLWLWRPFSMARLCSLSSVSSQGFPQFWVSQGGQVFCHGEVYVKGQKESQFILVFGGLFPMCKIVFLLVSYNLVLPDVLVVVCWTESQDKLAKGALFWVSLCG